MSSSYDAGKAADAANEVLDSKCGKGDEHDWKNHFMYSPSSWGECRKCGKKWFNK